MIRPVKAADAGAIASIYNHFINNSTISFEGQLSAQSIRSIIAFIALPNEGSERLHDKFGFVKSGEFKEIGYKFDRWINVAYWQLQIGD
jgi:L-amino acid N-acyltransferase YncA